MKPRSGDNPRAAAIEPLRSTEIAQRPRHGLWPRAVQFARRLLRLDTAARDPAVAPSDEAELGPGEARAVEKALHRWVQLQQQESKKVPTRRVDSDSVD